MPPSRLPTVLAFASTLLIPACERRPLPGAVSVVVGPTPPAEPAKADAAPAESLPTRPIAGAEPATGRPEIEPQPLDVHAWLSNHHLVADDFVFSDCRATQLGRPPRDGLVCTGGPPMEGSLRSGHSVFPMVALVAERGRLRVVMRTAVMAGAMDALGDVEEEDPAYVRLDVEVDRDGTRIQVRDSPGRTCADALQRGAQLGDLPTVRMVRLACASRGTYAWTRGRFERSP